MPLVVVRHAQAGRRSTYQGDDRVRPLSTRGRTRASALVPVLAAYRPRRILSSPFVRCCETVRPLADAVGIAVESVDELGEGHGADAVALLTLMAGESAVLCTHGDVAAVLLDTLVPDPDAPGRAGLRLQKGEAWVLRSDGPDLSIVEHLRRVGVPAPPTTSDR